MAITTIATGDNVATLINSVHRDPRDPVTQDRPGRGVAVRRPLTWFVHQAGLSRRLPSQR